MDYGEDEAPREESHLVFANKFSVGDKQFRDIRI